MNIAVTVTLDGLIRALRGAEHDIGDRAAKPRPETPAPQIQRERAPPADQQREGGR